MVILYPTETVYALGANAFDAKAVASLFSLKERGLEKTMSILVRDLADIERYAHMDTKAKLLAEKFLPGPLTLVLRARDEVPRPLTALDGTIGFRVSSDLVARKLIAKFMDNHKAPLTCTSANKSHFPTLATVPEILKQFGPDAVLIDEVHDDGARSGRVSTIVKIVEGNVDILREGSISEVEIHSVLD